ncbi:DUF5801 repeats-in-toxin domain-containing protein [Roseibium salinum]|uniref:DUF5801 repeats-in-toxin domain-containing protein n=1 Tax=Roseibium salinum TaxID=1604349 RepID=UPI00360B107C
MSTENTSSEFTSSPASWEETAPQEGAPSQSAENDSAAGEALVVAQADGEDISPVDAEDAAATDQPAAEGEEGSQQTVFTANDQNQVVLPANVSLDNAIIEGANLVFIQPDGTEITIENAALNVPTFLIDGVEIPQETLVAALQESGINVAAGPGGTLVATSTPDSSGGDFDVVNANLGDAGPILGLLGPTALQFPELTGEELATDFLLEESDPVITPLTIISIDPTGDTNPGNLFDPDLDASGTNPSGDGETTSFVATIQAGSSSVTDVVFNPYNGGTGDLSLMTTNVTGESLTADFTYELSVDAHTLTILADGVPVVELVIDFTPGADDIAPQTVGTVSINVTLLEGFPHEYATELDALIEGIRILAEDANGFTDVGTFDFTIVDDVPTIQVVQTTIPALVTDDSDITDSAGPVSFASLFTSVFGADSFKDTDDDNVQDVDAISYALSVNGGDGVDSGLNDTLSGNNILLRVNGDSIEGYLEGATGTLAFVISVDPATGDVTLTQNRSISMTTKTIPSRQVWKQRR